jgi:phage terminase large subunit
MPSPKRKLIYRPDEELPENAFTRIIPDGKQKGMVEVLYTPASQSHLRYHQSTVPNLIMEGRRGTGKSHTMRWDFHMRAMSYPGFKYLILRRTMPELRKSHLLVLPTDMEKLGGRALGVRSGNTEAHYDLNGSIGLFGHCETEQDVEKYLSAQFDAIAFDEITTFPWDMITRIRTSCRVLDDSGLIGITRGGTNPIGVSADDVYSYFIGHDVPVEQDPKYDPTDYASIHIVRDDNPYLDFEQYDKQFSSLPKAYRDAWLDGTWGVEGAYFTLEPAHLLKEMPYLKVDGTPAQSALRWPWIHIYRMLDYGWHDPTVCVWVAVLPNGREIPFMEESWLRTPAQTVAKDIKRLSESMKVITTIADPTLWNGEKEMDHCMAHVFEECGVPLTKGKNDRVAAGFAIQEHLNTNLADGEPKLQILETACPTLVKTLRAMRVDKKNPGRIADHKADHMPICLGYFCMANVGPTRIPNASTERPWMVSKQGPARVLGAYNVRHKSL